MSPLGIILLLGMTPPQHQMVAVQRTDVQAPSEAQRHIEQLASQGLAAAERAARAAAERAARVNTNCYAIRSYLFRREEGSAPVLVGTTTCTPANTVRPEQVMNPPKARLVPQ
ncbi:MAG TPA: hypothetical protein VI488_14790 [Candidatus Angelobacter sp.]